MEGIGRDAGGNFGLETAVATRGGHVDAVIFHSDRGCQLEYTATLFESACSTLGISHSMGRVGSCFDNAAAESWFSTLEWELFRKRHFDTKQTARREVAQFIDWSRYAGDPPAGRWGRSGCGHHRDRRLPWRSCRAWFAPQELLAVR